MSKEHTRRVRMDQSPEVTESSYSETITITTGSWHGQTRYELKGELTMNCAAELVRKLRRSMRVIRDEKTRRLARQVAHAEGEL